MTAALHFVSVTFAEMGCCVCGIVFAVSRDFRDARLKDRTSWYCPLGHSQHFTEKSEVEKLREELAQKTQRLQATLEWERSRVLTLDRRLSATRGLVTRIKNRVGNGVCPCCNRTFQNLLRHMATKHPHFKHEER